MTLAGHTRAVLQAVVTMFGEPPRPTRLGHQWLRFFGLDTSDFPGFFHTLWVAAATHDIGKANDGFARAIQHTGDQVIRHEHLSALMLWCPPLRDWFHGFQEEGVDPEIVVSAVVSHHLKVSDREFAQALVDLHEPVVRIYGAAPDVAEVLAVAGERLGVAPPDTGPFSVVWDYTGVIDPAREGFERAMHRFNRALQTDEHRRRLLLAVKAALIAADSSGSAVTRMDQTLGDWLDGAFGRPPLTDVDIEERVIGPRVQELTERRRWHGFRDFQDATSALGPRVLLLSGCGTGKTLAAWKWIAAQLAERPAARAIFLYPTRATALEGFRDYVSWAGEEAALISGTARYDLEGLFENPADRRSARDYTTPERMFALGYWHRRIFSGTVDSFLAFVNNRYAALCLLPVLADSVVVFDEVHSFDNHMFRALESFLRFFDVPALCMTASLPDDRLRILRDVCGLAVFPDSPERFEDLHRQAALPRYRGEWVDQERAFGIAKNALQEGKRVLWVVNTVARCQRVAGRLRDSAPAGSVLCYHSRFRLQDRRQRHEDVIRLFRSEGGPAIVVSTQVCEMSLDLDADILITEAADVPALIQRMGRCCREPIPPAGRIGLVYAYAPEGLLPYSRRDIEEGTAFMQWLAERQDASHEDLAGYLAAMQDRDAIASGGFTSFLGSGWYAMSRDDSFREEDDYAVESVLDRDIAAYLQAERGGAGRGAGLIVPVPRRLTSHDPRLGPYVRAAQSSRYCERLGYLTDEVMVGG